MYKYKVSIIIPCYNVEKYIGETVNSVLNQNYENLEIILIDDGSTDNTINILKKIEKQDNRIKLVLKNNEGVSATRNLGISIATGEYISFLDGDDLYLPYKILKQIKALVNSGHKACYCGTSVTKLNDKNSIKKINKYKKNGKILADFILQKAYITTNDWMIKKSLIDENNLKFNENYNFGEDFNFFMKILSLTEAVSVNEKLTIYRVNNNSSSFRKDTRINKKDNYIEDYIDWVKWQESLIYSKREIDEILIFLKCFLLPQVFIRNITFNKEDKIHLSKFEKDVLKSFSFNVKNIKASIKYYYLYLKIFLKCR